MNIRNFLLPLLLLTGNALGVTMTNLVTDGFGNPYPVRVIITPFTPSTVFGGTNVLGPSVAFNNNAAGVWSVNLLGGFYLVQQGLSQPVVPVYSNPGDGQTNSFAYFASAATNPIPSFFASGSGVLFVTNVVSATTYLVVTNVFSTNVYYLQTYAYTNLFNGPTNTVDLSLADQEFTATTSCAITGVLNKGTNTVNTSTLTFLGNAGTNITLTLASTIETRDGLRQYTITNGQDFIISLRYHPATGRTNAVTAIQF